MFARKIKDPVISIGHCPGVFIWPFEVAPMGAKRIFYGLLGQLAAEMLIALIRNWKSVNRYSFTVFLFNAGNYLSNIYKVNSNLT